MCISVVWAYVTGGINIAFESKYKWKKYGTVCSNKVKHDVFVEPKNLQYNLK